MKRIISPPFALILLALSLNLLLFLPHYLWHFDEASLWPFSFLNHSQRSFLELLFLSDNHNPFRICSEFLLASVLLWSWKKAIRWLRWPFILLYLFAFSYQVYYAFYQKFFGVVPSFLDDWLLIQDVLPVFFSTLQINNIWSLVLGLVTLLLLFAFLIWLLTQYLNRLEKSEVAVKPVIGLAVLFLFVLFGTWQYQHLKLSNPNLRILWITPRVLASSQVEYQLTTEYKRIQEAYGQYLDCPLEERKNIYHIFLESYGCTAYLSDEFGDRLRSLAVEMEDSLRRSGWFVSSTYSAAPIKGGRSWLSFTTGLTGIKLQNQYSYDSLLNVNYDYPHMVAFMNRQGYSTHRISTFRTTKQTDSLLSREELNAFWQFDDALFFDTFPYKGYRYDGLGGIPDQFAMGYFQDDIRPTLPGPHYLFFITTTSHTGFTPPPPIVEDWRLLNKIKESPTGRPWWVNVKSYAQRYADAITYNLEFWTHFIRKYGTEDDIFILTGDHQPPGLGHHVHKKYNDAAVPFHVISKDSTFTRSFYEHGLKNGLLPKPGDGPGMKHEGMYSLILHHLIKVYRSRGCDIPDYLPEGVTREE